MGDDERLIPLVTSVNVACGAHAGDPLTIDRTIRTAVAHGVAVGAHPGLSGPRRLRATRSRHGARRTRGVARLSDRRGRGLRPGRRDAAAPRQAARRPLQPRRPRPGAWPRRSPGPSPGSPTSWSSSASPGSALLGAPRRTPASPRRPRPSPTVPTRPTGRFARDGCPGALLESPELRGGTGALDRPRRPRQSHDGQVVEVRADTICVHGDTPGRRRVRDGDPGGARGQRRDDRSARIMSEGLPTIEPLGDAALLVTFGDAIDLELNERAHGLAAAVEQLRRTDADARFGRAVPAYASVLVPFDPLAVDPDEARGRSPGCSASAPPGRARPRSAAARSRSRSTTAATTGPTSPTSPPSTT